MKFTSSRIFLSLIWLSLLGLVACSAPFVSAGPFVYYVSADGDDSGSGLRRESAWKTLERATEQELKPGDTLMFIGNQPLGGELELDYLDGGDSSRPVRITAEPEFPGLKADGPAGITVIDTSGVLIENLEIFVEHDHSKQSTDGILLHATEGTGHHSGVTINQVKVQGAYNGISLASSGAGDGFENVTINKVNISDCIRNGIISYGIAAPGYGHKSLQILDSTVSGTRGIKDITKNSGSGIVIGSAEDVVVEGNETFNNGAFSNANEGPIGIWTHDSTRVLIKNNKSYDNKSLRADGGGFGLDIATTNSTIEGNISYNNAGPGILLIAHESGGNTGGNIVRYNASVGDSWLNSYHGGISVIGGFSMGESAPIIEDTKIHHNTVFPAISSGAAALKLRGNLSSMIIHHNIFDTSQGQAPAIAAEDINPEAEVSFVANQISANPHIGGELINWDGMPVYSIEQLESSFQGTYQNIDYPAIYPAGNDINAVLASLGGVPPLAVSATVPVDNVPATVDLLGAPLTEQNPMVGAISAVSTGQISRRQRTSLQQ